MGTDQHVEEIILAITKSSQVGQARRLAVSMAGRLGFTEAQTSKAAIVVSEVATNLVKYGQHGQLLMRSLECEGMTGLEILALDKGRGMSNLARCLRNGYSTASGAGTGLGAVIRLSSLFDIYSFPETGTALLVRVFSAVGPKTARTGLETGVVSVPKPGQTVNGDGWAIDQRPARSRFLVVDGLGHGPQAKEASQAAVRVFNAGFDPVGIIEAAHTALRHTRGAVMAVAEIDRVHQLINFVGVGNITTALVSSEKREDMISWPGTVGYEISKIKMFTYQWPKERGILVMHSDGLSSHWGFEHYRGLIRKHPALIAGVLYRDYNHGTDDSTIVVVRLSKIGDYYE